MLMDVNKNMNQIKRQLSNNELVDKTTKILQTTSIDKKQKSITTCFEDLSNELFYEIFEYFDGFNLFQIFSNINTRFQNLLGCTLLPLKIRVPFVIKSDFINQYNNIILPNKHRILSFSTLAVQNIDIMFSLMVIDSSFTRLESLILWKIKFDNLIPILQCLITLPRLFSLKIFVNPDMANRTDPYPMIFSLPVLTYIKVSMTRDIPWTPFWHSYNYQLSLLQYLVMNHPCTSSKLIVLLSFTPQLCRLSCQLLYRSDHIINEDVKLTLPNLTHLFFDRCSARFDEFEIFLKRIGFHLQVLRFRTSNDKNYLNSDRWEQLFIHYIPHLRIFEFKYDVIRTGELQFTTEDTRVSKFTSSFWIQRQWIIEFIIEINDSDENFITYFIHPYRKRWYQLNELNKNSSNSLQLSPSVILNRAGFDIHWDKISIRSFIPIFTALQVTHLIIECPNIYTESLTKLLRVLPRLDSLKVYSLSFSNENCSSNEEVKTFPLISKKYNITKVNLERLNKLKEVQFLIDLCPQMEYFEVDYPDQIDFKLLVKYILIENRQHIPLLHTLCFNGRNPIDMMIKELQNIINFEQVLQEYTIKCIDKKIYMQLE